MISIQDKQALAISIQTIRKKNLAIPGFMEH